MAPMTQLQASAARNIAAAGLQKHGGEDVYTDQAKRYKGGPSTEETTADDDIIRAQLQGSAPHL